MTETSDTLLGAQFFHGGQALARVAGIERSGVHTKVQENVDVKRSCECHVWKS